MNKIVCPTFVIDRNCDKIVGTAAASAIAEKINHSELFIYNGLGHAAYEEAEDFNERGEFFNEIKAVSTAPSHAGLSGKQPFCNKYVPKKENLRILNLPVS